MSETDSSAREAIVSLYSLLAAHPDGEFGWGRGRENARLLGYDDRWLEQLPDVAWESSAAVGNPFALGPIDPGDVVVDLGCGAGTDLCIAALLVGDAGRAIGIDMTPAMIAKARHVAEVVGLTNVELHVGEMEVVPLPDASVDVVISNGAINLSTRKTCVFRDAFRVLRRGGRLHIADMVRDGAGDTAGCGSWADCVSGTVEPQSYLEMLAAAGFEAVELTSLTGYRTAPTTIGATFRCRKP